MTSTVPAQFDNHLDPLRQRQSQLQGSNTRRLALHVDGALDLGDFLVAACRPEVAPAHRIALGVGILSRRSALAWQVAANAANPSDTLSVVIIERQSVIDAPVDRVWARVVTPEGINDELRPWMTMSMPRGTKNLTVDTVPVGTPIGRCWMRLFGLLPFDYDNLMIAELWPGRGFDEQSTMLSMRSWRHQRTVEPEGDTKTVVRDRLTFELRTPLRLLTPVIAAGIRALFGHRQRRLQKHFAS